MEYHFNQLDATSFQRLINAILVARFGEDVRITPLRGSDGGSDGETAPGHPLFEYQTDEVAEWQGPFAPVRPGRYLFQVKHHRTVDVRLSEARQAVVTDFVNELQKNVLARDAEERANYFILITNVPNSREGKAAIDQKRKELIGTSHNLHADVWWGEQVTAYLDQMPTLWNTFPEMFAGRQAPLIGSVAGNSSSAVPRALHLALNSQYNRDRLIKFRQIDLERDIFKLFVDLDVVGEDLGIEVQKRLTLTEMQQTESISRSSEEDRFRTVAMERNLYSSHGIKLFSGLSILTSEDKGLKKIILEGGPGQGKSTLTQMLAQIYRQQILGKMRREANGRWRVPARSRLPFRIELKDFADYLASNQESSVEEYLANTLKYDAGGSNITVDGIHTIVQDADIFLIFDGLDEVGSDEVRDQVLLKIMECVNRFEDVLSCNLKVIVTTRPPAIAGRRDRLTEFVRLPIAEMEAHRIDAYVSRWLGVHEQEEEERARIHKSFERRRNEVHVQALAKNPMQLSVLLHFIKLKGEAFPDRRAELYGEYFKIVIDRDVEKSALLRAQREIIEQLHQYLGYKIHALTEAKKADGSLQRNQLLHLVSDWLRSQGNNDTSAKQLFKLGEERLGLIVTLKGEGNDTWHGFAIQPVREYFAAAFINNQIKGNAHDVFEAMVRRPYWKEVALFLAGLRRTNEKADLVSRAKSLDQDPERGWKQRGRSLILQLLREGVFTQPRNVYIDALDFVMDLLDPSQIPVQQQPENYLDILSSIIKDGKSERHIQRLISLLQQYSSSSDDELLRRLYYIAARLLSHKQYMDAVLNYHGQNAQLKMKVRILWPCVNGIDISQYAKNSKYWNDVPREVSAYWWLNTAMRSNIAYNLTPPTELHNYVLEQFAMNHPYVSYNGEAECLKSPPLSNWAIWHLIRYTYLFNIRGFWTPRYGRDMSNEDYAKRAATFSSADTAEYNGLDMPTQKVIRCLINVSHQLLNTYIEHPAQTSDTLTKWTPQLLECLKEPGILSWLACRSITSMLRLCIASLNGWDILELSIDALQDAVKVFLDDHKEVTSLWNSLQSFYIERDLDKGSSDREGIYIFNVYPFRLEEAVPRKIWLKDGHEQIDVIHVLANHICKEENLPFPWLSYITLNSTSLPSLVEDCTSCLPEMLCKLADMRLLSTRTVQSLHVSYVQRILKLVRHSDTAPLLHGALVGLSSSQFLTVAGANATLKMLRAQYISASFDPDLFGRYRYENHDISPGERRILWDICKHIVDTPSGYRFRTVTYAAEYVAEHDVEVLSPLVEDEASLGITAG